MNTGAVITDTPVVGIVLTCILIPKTFIRYVGNSLHKTDYQELMMGRSQKYWLDNGMKRNLFFHAYAR